MILIPILSLLYLLKVYINFKQGKSSKINFRVKYFCIGLIIGPIIGSGLIANLCFKENWEEQDLFILKNLVEISYLLQHL